MSAERFDLVVVGAGSAGFSAAITAAERGARVALVGHGTIGGTCVNIGCVPSKTLIRAVETLHAARTASRFAGIRAEAHLDDWGALKAQKDALVASLRKAKYIDLLPAYPSLVYREGRARLVDGGVAVAGTRLQAPKIVIATGAAPALPTIPGIDDVGVLTSTEALDLTTLPRSLIVIGGGYIGCELGQMFARAGVAVTIVCRSRLLPAAEPEIGKALADVFAAEGITVRSGLAYERITRANGAFALAVRIDGRRHVIGAEAVLATTGRRPNTAGLGLEQAGVEVDAGGAIVVDAHMRTTNPDVYAAGDVTGRDQYVYMAAYGARLAAENALAGDRLTYDNRAMPAVVFTDPQVASVGLTEAAARARGIAVRTTRLDLEHVPRALAARDTRGFVKLVAEEGSDRLLGAHVVAPEGADTIQTAALALRQGLGVADLATMIAPYLTTVEALKLAAQTFDKDVARLSCCAG